MVDVMVAAQDVVGSGEVRAPRQKVHGVLGCFVPFGIRQGATAACC
jgi:hypothetical protein